MTPQERLVATAVAELGYIGHRSTALLDSPTANGGGKYTKYARDLDSLGNFYNGPKQGYDWCDVFVDWCFVTAFGRETAQKMLYQPNRSCGAGTGYSLGYYKAKGRLFTSPQVGDQIFFGDSRSTWHTGIVTAVTSGSITTVEGNSGSPLGVHEFRYQIGDKKIKGYGRPYWTLAVGEAPPAVQPSSPSAALKIGDIVEFAGNCHYSSANGNVSFPCRAGKAKVTRVAAGARHPYHLIHVQGGNVYGWVDAGDVTR